MNISKFIIIPGVLIAGIFLKQKDNPEYAKPISKQNGIYALQIKNLYVEVDSKNGGRISSFKIEEEEFLSGVNANADNWGSTFWTSPQSAWGWPPSDEIDKNAYTAKLKDNCFVLTSAKDEKLGYVVSKEFYGNLTDTSLVVKYTITNNAAVPQALAPWEITRVAPHGLSYFPSGKKTKKGDLTPLTEDSKGITWFSYNGDKIPPGVPKLISDGSEGWFAQVNRGIILLKKFEDVPAEKMAPEEGEIELYANPDKSYIEIEQQGEYTTLIPGQSLTWEVKWYLRKLPKGIVAEPGNDKLIRYTKSIGK